MIERARRVPREPRPRRRLWLDACFQNDEKSFQRRVTFLLVEFQNVSATPIDAAAPQVRARSAAALVEVLGGNTRSIVLSMTQHAARSHAITRHSVDANPVGIA